MTLLYNKYTKIKTNFRNKISYTRRCFFFLQMFLQVLFPEKAHTIQKERVLKFYEA